MVTKTFDPPFQEARRGCGGGGSHVDGRTVVSLHMMVVFQHVVVCFTFCTGGVLMLPSMKLSVPADANTANGADLNAYLVMVSSPIGSIFFVLSSIMNLSYNAGFTWWKEGIIVRCRRKFKHE